MGSEGWVGLGEEGEDTHTHEKRFIRKYHEWHELMMAG